MSVMGVDPGLTGALAIYGDDGSMQIIDMPSYSQMIGRKTRKRIDLVDLHDFFDMAVMLGVELVIIESVGGRPKQSASAGFVFGYTVGCIMSACIFNRLPVETIPPQVWKRILKVPGKKGEASDREYAEAIIHRADELMPDHAGLWRGPNGGKKLDRAEAAMLALYGRDYALGSTKQINIRDPEWRMVYKNAETGA